MPYRHRVLSLLFLLSMVTYLDRVCIAVAGPEMQKDLGLSPSQWGWVVGIFALSYALFEIPSGALGDRIGPRKVLTRIVLWWSAFTSLTGLVSSFYLLLATRFAFGMGEAGAYPNASSSISRWFPLAERARAHGTVWMASRVGGALTPLLVVPIVAAWGWRSAFYLFGIIGVVWAAAWYWWYRDYPTEMPGVTAEELAHIGDSSARRAHHSLPWAQVVKNPNFWVILLMYHAYCWGSYFYVSWMPTYLRLGRGFTADEMKIYAMLPFVAGALGNLTGGIAQRRAGAPARAAQRPALRRRGGSGGVGALPLRHGGGREPVGRRGLADARLLQHGLHAAGLVGGVRGRRPSSRRRGHRRDELGRADRLVPVVDRVRRPRRCLRRPLRRAAGALQRCLLLSALLFLRIDASEPLIAGDAEPQH